MASATILKVKRGHNPGLSFVALAAVVWLIAGAQSVDAQPAPNDRIAIDYVDPTNREHDFFRDLLKRHGALERMRDRLSSIRWPRTLRLELKGCDGDSNASYDDAVITVCYEFMADFWKSANSSARPQSITMPDAFVGPFFDTFLHEAGHAMFDLLKIPVLGREEDAADQISTYLMLQFPAEEKRRLILGSAYSYASELRVRNVRDLYRPRISFSRHIASANEHSTPAQRLFNLLCIAYGSDKELFAELVEKNYLPKERAEMCADEYRQVDFAYRTLIEPHVDK